MQLDKQIEFNHEISWLNKNHQNGYSIEKVDISDKEVILGISHCSPFFKIKTDQLCKKSILIPNKKIISAYHNPKGYDLIFYEDNMVSYSGWQKQIGILRKLNNEKINNNIISKNNIPNKQIKLNTHNKKNNTSYTLYFIILTIIIIVFYLLQNTA
jgi:hypothetical protein